jgi:hypothetical protein
MGKVANRAADGLAEADCQQALREQHRAAVAATRDGKIKQWLAAAPPSTAGPDSKVTPRQ